MKYLVELGCTGTSFNRWPLLPPLLLLLFLRKTLAKFHPQVLKKKQGLSAGHKEKNWMLLVLVEVGGIHGYCPLMTILFFGPYL